MSIRSLWDKFDAATRDWLMGHPGCLIVPRTLAEAMNRALRPSTGGWNGIWPQPGPGVERMGNAEGPPIGAQERWPPGPQAVLPRRPSHGRWGSSGSPGTTVWATVIPVRAAEHGVRNGCSLFVLMFCFLVADGQPELVSSHGDVRVPAGIDTGIWARTTGEPASRYPQPRARIPGPLRGKLRTGPETPTRRDGECYSSRYFR